MIDVNPNHLETVTHIVAGHVPECEVRAFGSRVTWTAKDYSDLDLVVVGERALDLDALRRLKEAFEESNLPFRVDVLDWHAISAAFRKVIGKKYEVVQKGKQKSLGMAGEWRDTTLGQVTDFLSGGTPSKDTPRYWRGSIPWVSAKDMKRFRLDDTEDHVTEDGVANGTKLVPAGTVLLLARGMTLLNDVPICVANRPITFNQDVKALRPKPEVRDDFLPYLLLGNKARLLNLVDLAGHGTGRLNSDELKALDVVLPTEPEQRSIAHILGTLDDKIELNRRMNETLEAMARALFKSWFVDFDPVRAKAEGRLPAGRQATHPPSARPGKWFVYALECENGSVYIGHSEDVSRRYEEHVAGKGADWTKRHPPRRIAYWEELETQQDAIRREKQLKTGSGREWLKREIEKTTSTASHLPQPPCLPDMQVANLFPDSFEDSELGEIPKGWKVKPLGELLELAYGKALKADNRQHGTVPVYGSNGQVGWHDEKLVTGPGVIVGRKGNPGVVKWVPTDFFPIDTTFYVVPKDGCRSLHFLFYALKLQDLGSLGADSAVPGLNRNLAYMSKQIVPSRSFLDAFDSSVQPLFQRIYEAENESRTLATLRDTLLPKLLSGELRVPSTDKVIGVQA